MTAKQSNQAAFLSSHDVIFRSEAGAVEVKGETHTV